MTIKQETIASAVAASFDFMWQAPWEKKRRASRTGFKGAKQFRAKRKAKNKMAKQSRRANSR